MARITLLTAISLVIAGPSLADSVELSGGGHLTGKVTRTADAVIVAVDDDIRIAVPNSRVRRVVTSNQLQRYRAQAAKAGNDPEAHYRVGIWCMGDGNVPGDPEFYKLFHMRRAIELDPDHERARAQLGYTRNKGKWILSSKLMRDRGMIRVGGKGWTLPEAAAIEESADSSNVASKKWIRDVARLTKSVMRNAKNAQESLESLRSIQDPQAAAAIAQQLRESRIKGTQNRALRKLWIELLARFRNNTSVEALVRAGIDESDAVIREAALDKLLEFGSGSAVATYLPMLAANDNRLVNRAAQALSWFPDRELAMTYVDALVTEHTEVLPPGAGMNATFTGDGGGGLSTGGKAIPITKVRENPAVLALLTKVEPDVNFGYDEDRWRAYFSMKRSSFSGDLRRDP